MPSPIVLCIDDRPQMLKLRKATLESIGYCVKTASSAGAAKSEPLEELVRVIERLARSADGAEARNLAPASDGCCHRSQSAA